MTAKAKADRQSPKITTRRKQYKALFVVLRPILPFRKMVDEIVRVQKSCLSTLFLCPGVS